MTTYWKVTHIAVRDKILSHMISRDKMLKEAAILAKECGADVNRVLVTGGPTSTLIGFVFKKDPDPKQWIYEPKYQTWRPRRNKSELAERFYSIKSDAMSRVCEVIGIPYFACRDGHLVGQVPGVKIRKADVFLACPDGTKPVGCKRISDLEYARIR